MRYETSGPCQPHSPEQFEDFNAFYRAMDLKLRPILAEHFPTAAADFNPPSISKLRNDFENHLELAQPWLMEDTQPTAAPEVRTALKTVALVRYIDDFIDNHVWSDLNLPEPTDRQRFTALLDALLAAGKELDSHFTAASLEIFRVEASLAAQPTQENFDQKFRELFRAKSYDIVLCYCQVHHLDINLMHTELVCMGIVDCFRDLEEPLNHKESSSTDFDIYRFIIDHQLDAAKLISFVEVALRHLSTEVFDHYQLGETADQMAAEHTYGSGILLIVRGLELLKTI